MMCDIRISKEAWTKFKIKVIQENTSIANKLGEMIEREVIEYHALTGSAHKQDGTGGIT
jgi:hypothetical protein